MVWGLQTRLEEAPQPVKRTLLQHNLAPRREKFSGKIAEPLGRATPCLGREQ